jgi:hypothetical protein
MGTDVFQITNQFNITAHIKEISQTENVQNEIISEQMSAAPSICVKRRFYMALCLHLPNSKNTKQHNLQVCYLN